MYSLAVTSLTSEIECTAMLVITAVTVWTLECTLCGLLPVTILTLECSNLCVLLQ